MNHHIRIYPNEEQQRELIEFVGTEFQSEVHATDNATITIRDLRIPFQGGVPDPRRIDTCQVLYRGGEWRIEYQLKPDIRPLPPTGNAVGVDPGIYYLVATSKGKKVKPHPDIVRIDKRIQQFQIERDSKHIDSSRYREISRLIERLELRQDDIRLDQFNKIAHKLCEHNDIICLEDTEIETGAIHQPEYLHAGRRARWDQLKQIIEFRAIETGRRFVLVPRWWSSQTCSQCRRWVAKSLDQRQHHCPHCGFQTDRDTNGALEILNRGMEILDGSTRTDWHPILHPHYVGS